MVQVCIVSVVCRKNNRQKLAAIKIEEEKYYWEIADYHYLTQRLKLMDIKKQSQKLMRNKTVLVYIISVVVCRKNSGQKMVATQMKEEKY